MTSAAVALQLYDAHLKSKDAKQPRCAAFFEELNAFIHKNITVEGRDPRKPLEVPARWEEFTAELIRLGWLIDKRMDQNYEWHSFIWVCRSTADNGDEILHSFV